MLTISRFLVFGLVGLPTFWSRAATNDVPAQVAPTNTWVSFKQPGRFVVSLVQDGRSNIWVGTEGNGIFRYNPQAATNQWTRFTVVNGLGDNYAYALACDHQGRIWAGHLNHGVSVFNGSTWKNYDVIDGPIGERVFRIAASPLDGDVWLATSAGLTRYSITNDSWTDYTRKDGLPSDQANALAFDKKGNLYVGTQCDGIAIANAATDYHQWRTVSAPATLPASSEGSGLPTAQINDLLVSTGGTVFAATSAGLAYSTNQGVSWNYLRGRDYAAKARWQAGGGVEETNLNTFADTRLLPEDYVTCMAEDSHGLLRLGFRRDGFATYNIKRRKINIKGSSRHPDSISCILPVDDAKLFCGSYGSALSMSFELGHKHTPDNPASPAPMSQPTAETRLLRFPTPAQAPSLEELNDILREIRSVPPRSDDNQPAVFPVEDDWRTEGQWMGRYGRFWIVLCANWSPYNDIWGAGWDVAYTAQIGPNHAPGDALRDWIQFLATDDNRSLEMSPTYFDSRLKKGLVNPHRDRRQSEWDDGGEKYSMTEDGPDIVCTLNVPPGQFYLSLYDNNKDGHQAFHGRFRDYYVSIKLPPGHQFTASSDENNELAQKSKEAQARIENFWPGVYKRFFVNGPTQLTIQIKRNYSYNTILAGVTLDLVDELPPPYYQSRQEWAQKRQNLKVNVQASAFAPATTLAEAVARLFEALQILPAQNETWWLTHKRLFYLPLLRSYLEQKKSASQNKNFLAAVAHCYYELELYPQWEDQLRYLGITPTRDIEKALQWDGHTYSTAGQEPEIISRYLGAHPPIK